jgi:hypothetical protein
MEKEFVPYDLALRIEQIGFEEECFGYYEGETLIIEPTDSKKVKDINNTPIMNLRKKKLILAPTWKSAFNWLRDKYKIYGVLKPIIGSKNGYDSYPILGWDFDLFITNLDKDNSYYMGYPIGEWFTATLDRLDEGDVLSDYVEPMTHEAAELTCLENIIGIIELRTKTKEKILKNNNI